MIPDPTRRLRRLVLQVVLLGLLAQTAVALLVPETAPLVDLSGSAMLGWATGPALAAALLLLVFLGDLVAVPIRHEDDQTEELTLFEPAVVVAALLLPLHQALLVPVAASVLTSLVRRRQPVKAVFNAGNLAAGTAALVGVLHLATTGGSGIDARAVVALCVGTLAFTVLNLVALARVLAVVGDEDPSEVVRHGLRLAAVTAAGSVALGASTVTLAWAAPALLPLSVMPAAALAYAYRAAATEIEERTMSARLLELSELLAGRLQADEVLDAFLALSRGAFGADAAVAVLHSTEPGAPPTVVAHDPETGTTRGPADLAALGLLGRGSSAQVVDTLLPGGWRRAALAPLEADGRPLGVVALGVRGGARHWGARQLPLLTPLASALGVALRGAEQHEQLVEETSKLQAVVDASSDGILVLDGDGAVLLWSPAMAALTGLTSAQAAGRPLRALLRATGPDGAPLPPDTGREALHPGAPQTTVELVLHREDGEQRVVRCAHAGVFADDALVRDVVIVHDVTRERQVERLKADFIATVSHELRTPVTPIKGYADLLRKRGDRMTPERRNECLEVISDRCDHLGRLVEDLLLASRISATEGSTGAQVELAEAELGALVRRAAGDADSMSGRVRLVLPEEPVVVGCDPLRTVQVLANLVGNALKYSEPGTPVEVELHVVGERAVVDVRDTGRGIPNDQLERVFEKFHRVEDPMRMTTGGTGLGLYIARNLATAMGGTLSCTSVLGEGSVFRFALGLAAPEGSAVPAPRASAAAVLSA